MNDTTSNKNQTKELEKRAREAAKQQAEQRRQERKSRKRKCVVCGVDENEKTPFIAHPDGIGPSCRDTMTCEYNRAQAQRR